MNRQQRRQQQRQAKAPGGPLGNKSIDQDLRVLACPNPEHPWHVWMFIAAKDAWQQLPDTTPLPAAILREMNTPLSAADRAKFEQATNDAAEAAEQVVLGGSFEDMIGDTVIPVGDSEGSGLSIGGGPADPFAGVADGDLPANVRMIPTEAPGEVPPLTGGAVDLSVFDSDDSGSDERR